MFVVIALGLGVLGAWGRAKAPLMGATAVIEKVNGYLDGRVVPELFWGPTGRFRIDLYPEKVIWERFCTIVGVSSKKRLRAAERRAMFVTFMADKGQAKVAVAWSEGQRDTIRAARRIWEKQALAPSYQA